MLTRNSITWPLVIATGVCVLAGIAVTSILEFRHYSKKVAPPPFYTDTRGREQALCPAEAIVMVVFGQSLAANSHEHIYRRTPNKDLYQYFRGQCFYLADPLMGATGEDGSIWVPVASRLSALTSEPIVIIAGGVGGSAIAEWTALSSPLVAPLRAQIAQASRSGMPPNIYVWMQGEADAERGTSAERYEADLRRLHSLFGGAPWLVTANSICTNVSSRSHALDQARRNFALSTPDVEVSVDLDSLGTDYRTSDRCHFNRRGQELASAMIAAAVARLVKKQ